MDAPQLAALKQALLRKGSEMNEKLTRLLAGESFDIERLLVGGEPGATPIERLQRFLGIVDERLRAMREGRYGRCEKCGEPLSFAALQEAPWVTRVPRATGALDFVTTRLNNGLARHVQGRTPRRVGCPESPPCRSPPPFRCCSR